MSIWSKLAGIMRFQTLFIEGEGGGAGGGSGAGAGGGGTGSGAGSGGGTPASVTTTTAAPVTPAPDTSRTAAPASTQTIVRTLVDETGKPTRELGEEAPDFLHRFRAWRTEHPETDEQQQTPAQIAEAARLKAAAAASAGETPEQKTARETKERADAARAAETPEQKTAREKTEKEEADRQAAAAASGEPELYDLSPIPTEKLSKAMKDHPVETAAFLAAVGMTEDDFYASSRLAARATEYMQAGLPTIESAKHAVQTTKAFRSLDDSFTDIKAGDMPSTSKFLNDALLPLTYLRDENGNVKIDPQTKMPLTDGTAFVFMDNLYALKNDFTARQIERAIEGGHADKAINLFMADPHLTKVVDAIAAYGKKMGGDAGDNILAAVNTLKGIGRAGLPAGDENLPAEVRARLADAERQKAEAAEQRKTTEASQAVQHEKNIADFTSSVLAESSTAIDKIINDYLDKTSAKDDSFVRDTVLAKVRAGIFDVLSNDGLYLSQRDGITRKGLKPGVKTEWVALNTSEAKARLRTVSEPIFAQASIRILSKDEQRKGKIDTQKKGSQMETQGGTTTALPGAAASNNPHDLAQRAKDNLRARGEDVTTTSVLQEVRKLKAAGGATAA